MSYPAFLYICTMEKKIKIYLASSLDLDKRQDMKDAKKVLVNAGFDVYAPVEHLIPHAWDYPNNEWGLMVFTSDVNAINDCDVLVLLSYGRYSSAGANWEAGYAFGHDKTVIVVEMTDSPMSLMVANGRWATVKGISGLSEYDWENMPKTRTNTEQK